MVRRRTLKTPLSSAGTKRKCYLFVSDRGEVVVATDAQACSAARQTDDGLDWIGCLARSAHVLHEYAMPEPSRRGRPKLSRPALRRSERTARSRNETILRRYVDGLTKTPRFLNDDEGRRPAPQLTNTDTPEAIRAHVALLQAAGAATRAARADLAR